MVAECRTTIFLPSHSAFLELKKLNDYINQSSIIMTEGAEFSCEDILRSGSDTNKFVCTHIEAAEIALAENNTAAAQDLLALTQLQLDLASMESMGDMTGAQISELLEQESMNDGDPDTDYCLVVGTEVYSRS